MSSKYTKEQQLILYKYKNHMTGWDDDDDDEKNILAWILGFHDRIGFCEIRLFSTIVNFSKNPYFCEGIQQYKTIKKLKQRGFKVHYKKP